jgi:hypothetical protein
LAYRVTLNPLCFLTAGVLALAIALGGHTLRVACANPFNSLRLVRH